MKYEPSRAFYIPLERRRFLKALAAASAGFMMPGYYAEALTIAPNVTQGPYYPLAKNVPLDDDNDLLYLNDNTTAATGLVTYLSGRVLDSSGNPIKDALVEIWHADNGGSYIYSQSSTRNSACDANFQGFGQFLTGSTGAYLFRTVKAGLYQGRTRHYHLAVTVPGQTTRYTTQTFWNETAYTSSGQVWSIQNSTDSVFSPLTTAQQADVNLTYTAIPNTSSVAATFDFVVGLTPVEPTYPASGGFLVAQSAVVNGPSGSTTPRFALTFPVYSGYTYEVYGNPTFADTSWAALPFAMTQTGSVAANRYTATTDGSLTLYVNAAALKGFYHVSFRVPGANTGTP